MNRAIPFLLLVVVSGFISAGKREKHSWTDGKLRVSYEMRNGLLDGAYTSWYANGKKKAKGEFRDNQRVGDWFAWDSTGALVIQRHYDNSLQFQVTNPDLMPDEKSYYDSVAYKTKYNEKGFVAWSDLKGEDVAVAKRVWRFLPRDEQSPLFAGDSLLRALQLAAMDNYASVFADDEFKIKLRPGMLQNDSGGIPADAKLIGFRIKEDWFLDYKRRLAETRMLSIAPVLVSGKDTLVPGWFYYPEIRSVLARHAVSGAQLPSNIHTLDDVLFFRYFRSTIYKESNTKDWFLQDYVRGSDLAKEQERIEIEMLEMEHSFWIEYAP